MTKVLVLDAMQRSALAVTRSLGKKSIDVTCADERMRTLAGASKYCKDRVTYPSPQHQPDAFIEALVRLAEAQRFDALFPVSDRTTSLVLKHRSRFTGVRIPYRNPQAFDLLSDKGQLAELAAKLGIRVPRTRMLRDRSDAIRLADEIGYPIVIKPVSQAANVPLRGQTHANVYYATDCSELLAVLENRLHLRQQPILLQQFIRGTGAGLFTLFHNGAPVVFFAHRRLREKPPSGGVSVLSESCVADPELVEVCRKILRHVGWDGVAMVEFKLSSEGTPYLMEVNARFWGSMQLAVDAGVDFPYLQYQSVMGETPSHSGAYRTGIRERWLLGDLDHLYIRFKNPRRNYPGLPSAGGAVWEFMKLFQSNTYYEVNRWEDIRPFWFELRSYLAALC